MSRRRKTFLVLVCLFAIVLGIIVVYMIVGKDNSLSTDYKESEREDVILYDGREYRYNEHLSNYLFMGIDTREQAEEGQGRVENGRADAIYLVSYDRVKKTAICFSIPRDTMTSIHTYAVDGSYLGMTEDHINMQYLYGDGKDKSCRMMKDAVSGLMYGIPIQGYCSLNMDGIPVAVGALKSVEVVLPNDSLEPLDPKYKEGTKLTITEDNAETFVRYRDVNIAHSAIARMERQKAFVEAFARTAKIKMSEETELMVDMYQSLKPYMVTNMSTDLFVDLLDAEYNSNDKIQDIPGEKVDGSEFDEYHVDETQLFELVLQYFYNEVQGD